MSAPLKVNVYFADGSRTAFPAMSMGQVRRTVTALSGTRGQLRGASVSRGDEVIASHDGQEWSIP